MSGRLTIGIAGGVIGLLIVLAGTWLALNTTASAYARAEADAFIAEAERAGTRISYDGLNFDPLSRRFEMTGVTIRRATGEGVQVERLVVTEYDDDNPRPHYLAFRLEGLAPPVETMGPAQQSVARALGLDRFDASFAYRYEPSARTLAVRRVSVSVPKGAELNLSFTLGNVDTLDLNDPAAAQAALLRASFVGGEILFRDEGLVGRMIETFAPTRNVEPQAFRQQMVEEAQRFRDNAGHPFLAKLAETAAEFLANENARAIRITAKPENPVPYTELESLAGDYDALEKRLSLTFKTE